MINAVFSNHGNYIKPVITMKIADRWFARYPFTSVCFHN
ncbi:hypothetical protein SAMD00023519_00723 [Listeria monocytogenes]|nr:hypothetical protein SAMD00023519_00723 [Listeria monocytogenes]